IIGAMVLGLGFTVVNTGDVAPVVMPLVIAAAGIVCSIVGTFFVRVREGGNPQVALDIGAFGAAGVMAALTFAISYYMWPKEGSAIRVPGSDVALADAAGNTVLITWSDVGIATVI